MNDGTGIAKYTEPKACSVTCVQDRTVDGETVTVKTTWSCSSHTPPDDCIIRAFNERRNSTLEEAAVALHGRSHNCGAWAAAEIRKLKTQ